MNQKKIKLTLLCAVVLWGISCSSPAGPNYGTEANTGDGMGTLILRLPGTKVPAAGRAAVSRSVLSDPFIGTLEYRITLKHSGGGVVSLEAGGGKTAVPLQEGGWTIAVSAYVSSAPGTTVGSGGASVTVVAGQDVSVKISMSVDPAYEALLTEIYIHNEAELRRVGAAENGLAIDDPGRTFYLENDIVLTQPWTPIGSPGVSGDPGNPFKAKFDGGGHTITINSFADLSAAYLGLFGYTDGAEIKNLKLHCNLGDIEIPLSLTGAGSIYAGALTGYADTNSLIENITVSGSIATVTSSTASGLYAGGITGGTFEKSKIRSSHVRANLYAEGQGPLFIGGIAGVVKEGTSSEIGICIEKSSFTGNLRGGGGGASGNDGVIYAGGIIGAMPATGMISGCYASGMVYVESDGFAIAGGIAGSGTTIEQCYAWTSVTAVGNSNVYAGGIGGKINSGTFSQCYALGEVTVSNTNNSIDNCWAGGIAGNNYMGTIQYCAALNDFVGSGNSPYAYGIAGSNEGNCMFTNNFAAGDMEYDKTDSTLSHSADLDGDTSFALADFKRPLPIPSPYDSGKLNWTFGGDSWKWIDNYDYPVLSWQTEPPADPSTFLEIDA
jgi:hypothetical protein